jgi:hypothetical protein
MIFEMSFREASFMKIINFPSVSTNERLMREAHRGSLRKIP